jgi:mutator protein MutT
LLALKKRGFGEGLWNGAGGKLEKGETPEQAMIRETQEEIGITPTVYKEMARLYFEDWFKGERSKLVGYVFIATDFLGEPGESDEMRPQWFDLDSIPYSEMLEDDRYWLPEILAGNKIKGKIKYDGNMKLVSHKITKTGLL